MTDSHPADHPDDELVDLALGHVAGERRAALAEHLLACPRCRQEHAALVAGVEAVAAAAPPVQPPLGFDERTLALMAAPAPAARRRRRWLPVAAATALLALLLGGGIGAWWAGRDTPADTEDRVAALATDAGDAVGTATVTEVDGAPVLVVGLTDGAEGASYTCRMRFADGSTLDTDPWFAAPGAAWLVRLPADRGPLTSIDLLPPGSSTPWSSADLHP